MTYNNIRKKVYFVKSFIFNNLQKRKISPYIIIVVTNLFTN